MHERAIEIILAGCGAHFDSDVTGAFTELADKFHTVAIEYADNEDCSLDRIRQALIQARSWLAR